MPANAHLSIGTMLVGRYRIDQVLGQGDYGVMYKAWDTRLDNPCALKENLETSPEATRQFTQQAAQLSGLRHPNQPHCGTSQHMTCPLLTSRRPCWGVSRQHFSCAHRLLSHQT